jgi:S-adenosyl methyltransferase
MAGDQDWVPAGVDARRANSARVYDYWLGGTHNFLADQDLGRAIAAVDPIVREGARANRAFLGRAVRFLSQAGIRQFLDIGSGIPTQGNVHEVARETDPAARVVYADIDPVAIAHSTAILAGQENTAVIEADLRDPADILARDQGTNADKPATATAFEKVYNTSSATAILMRSRAEIARFFGDFDLVDPGLVYVSQWRPGSPGDVPATPSVHANLVGVARKP